MNSSSDSESNSLLRTQAENNGPRAYEQTGQPRTSGRWGKVHALVLAAIVLGGLTLFFGHRRHLSQGQEDAAENVTFVFESLSWEDGGAPSPVPMFALDNSTAEQPVPAPAPAPRAKPKEEAAPERPGRISVTDWGAVPDGTTDNTAAIRSSLAACPAAAVPCTIAFDTPGNYLTGPIRVERNDVTIIIPPGSTLQFAANMSLYEHIPYPEFPFRPAYPPPPKGLHEAMMTVRNTTGFALTGGGAIDANGEFHVWEHEPPVSSIYVIGSSRVEVRNITVMQPAIITLHTQYCTGVTISDLNIIGTPGTREDGLLIDCTQDALIERVHYEGSGIGLCFASGDADEGREANMATSNILVRDIELVRGDGMVLTSAMAGGYRNITFRNILLDGTSHKWPGKMMRGIRIKAKAKGTGGIVEDITFDGIVGKSLHHAFHIDMFKHLPAEYKHKRIHEDYEQTRGYHSGGVAGSDTPIIRRVTYRNVTVHGMESECGKFEILPESPMQEIHFEHIRLTKAHEGWKCEGGGKMMGSAQDVSPPFPRGCGPQ